MRLPPARTKAPPVPDAVPAPDDGAPSCDPRAASLVEGFCDALRVERNALDVLADPTRYEAGQEVGLKFLNVKFYEEGAKA